MKALMRREANLSVIEVNYEFVNIVPRSFHNGPVLLALDKHRPKDNPTAFQLHRSWFVIYIVVVSYMSQPIR